MEKIRPHNRITKPDEDTKLTVGQLADDGIEVARHVARHLGKRKVILMGSSWGSVLGVHMAAKAPELFCAYVGTAQLVSDRDNRSSYPRTLALARAAGDQDSIAKLEALGPPPWTNPRNWGTMRRVTRKYEAMTTEAAPASWWQLAPQYATPQAKADYTDGEDYSFLQFVGWKGDGMLSTIDLYKLGTSFRLPFFLVQGTEDLVTTADVTQRYYDKISAPAKELVMVPRTGHDPNRPMVEAQARILNERVRKACE